MADVRAFKCVRPSVEKAAQIAALPYDVYNRAEAKEVVKGNPQSFLAIDRAETNFPDEVDTYDARVYAKANEMIQDWIAKGSFVRDDRECYYIYELTMNGRTQRGIVACSSIDDYVSGVIKKHENTRADKELDRINPSAFGEIQGIWDACHREAKLNLVVCGSVNRLMRKVFFNYAEPLYGRNTGHLRLQPFGTALLKEILASYRPAYTPQDLLTLWTLTGGVPRYVQLLLDGRAVTHAKMIEAVLSPTSSFLDEGRTILAEEFGADYETYFSVLSER